MRAAHPATTPNWSIEKIVNPQFYVHRELNGEQRRGTRGVDQFSLRIEVSACSLKRGDYSCIRFNGATNQFSVGTMQ